MMKSRIYEVETIDEHSTAYADGYRYNVRVKTRDEVGRIWYCGIGKFCKTKKDAMKYIEQFEAA